MLGYGLPPNPTYGLTQPTGAGHHDAGQVAPASAQALISSPNCFWVPGAGVRPAPGCQPQPTSSSSAMCVISAAISLPPLRSLSLICRQICPSVLPCQAISAGASAHFGLPGTPAGS